MTDDLTGGLAGVGLAGVTDGVTAGEWADRAEVTENAWAPTVVAGEVMAGFAEL